MHNRRNPFGAVCVNYSEPELIALELDGKKLTLASRQHSAYAQTFSLISGLVYDFYRFLTEPPWILYLQTWKTYAISSKCECTTRVSWGQYIPVLQG